LVFTYVLDKRRQAIINTWGEIMKLIFRISIAVYSLISMAIWLFIMLITIFKQKFLNNALAAIADEFHIPFLATRGIWFVLFLVSLGCLVYNVYIFMSGIRGDRERNSISRTTAIGEIKISPATFENIAINVIRRLNGIRDAKAHVFIKDDDVRLDIKAVFLSDVNIPALCEEAQTRIKQAIETCTGVIVSEVKFNVDSVYTVYKGRVE